MRAWIRDMLRVISVIPCDRGVSIFEISWHRWHYGVDLPPRMFHFPGRWSGQESVIDAFSNLWKLGFTFLLSFLDPFIRVGCAFRASVIRLGSFVELPLEVSTFVPGFSILSQSAVETALLVSVVRLSELGMVDAGFILDFLPIHLGDIFVVAAFTCFAFPLVAIARSAFSKGGIDLLWSCLLVLTVSFVGPGLLPIVQVAVELASFCLQIIICSCVLVGGSEHRTKVCMVLGRNHELYQVCSQALDKGMHCLEITDPLTAVLQCRPS